MRNVRMRRNNLLLTILALSLTLTPAMFAQQRSVGSAAAGDSTQEDRQPAPPLDCKHYDEYLGGKQDNFALPPEPLQVSPGLSAFFSSNHVTPRQFDEPGLDKPFGYSFSLRCCKICRAELEITIKRQGPLDANDAITIGQAPFTGPRAASGYFWQAPFVPGAGAGQPSPVKTITIPLSVSVLNGYVSKGDGCNVPLDIYVQDDTAVDYIKLKIWTW